MTPADASPPGSSSPDSSGLRFSFDTRSTTSAKINGHHHRTWWFEDLARFGPDMIEKGARIMVLRKLDHVTISRFLFYYLKAGLANAGPEERRRATETVVGLLCSLDRGSVSCRSLFWILRVSSSQNLSKCCRSRLESMIGVRIDEVTLDSLLVPAQPGTGSLYDVDLVTRFLRSFLGGGGREVVPRLRKVGSLMDLYLPEVAPDSGLKPGKFAALATALPDAARDSHDEMYRAIDMYLEVHGRLSEEEKMKICRAINYEKLSVESCRHLAQNRKFPSRTAIQALVSQQSKLRSLLKEGNSLRSSGCREGRADRGEQMVLYAKKADLSGENEKLRANLRGMQWRVTELEKVCRSMQSQMSRVTKRKVASHGGSRSLPKLCS
ncbi:BTB/POZ domain-containing protein-like [Iris pallida]|uniref:BTB/POZ domain-containing protein-like n=1 Tax=Iris pallida TaxID=29817 RepID=A0AAX6EG22_IRIPA|nr:BTB/POZ domain-containing protein-like [Iris pallida]